MTPTQFIAALRKGKTAPVYFLRGPDRFVHEECRKAIWAALPAEAREWCLAEIAFEAKHLRRELEDAYQMPMLGRHSFFIFADPDDFRHSTDEDYDALEDYLKRPSTFATVVFAAVGPDRRRRFIQLLEKKGELVDMRPLNRGEAARWLREYLARAGVGIEAVLAEGIAAKFENLGGGGPAQEAGVNLLWMRTEIEKVLAAKPDAKRLERADLDLMVAFREEHEIGKLLGAIAERQPRQALENLRALLASKQSEVLLLWSIADLVRQALRVASGRGSTSYQGARAGWGRRPFSTQEIALLAARKYSHQELLHALQHVRRADLAIKSSWKDSRILLEFLVWQIVVGKASGGAQPITEEVPLSSEA
ncbi:MAG: DNA polymerase III subunit delta [Acidobacteria bacterium]|nr:MAG: DNA polymerase III subunit delta [Acidobacteriota bacterium]